MRLFIGCTSKDKIDSCYLDNSSKLIKELAKLDNVDLVYGVFDKGLLKIAYDEFSKNNKKITGVITTYHKESFKEEKMCDLELIANTTTNRFESLYKNSDILLFLPGGIGTYAEIFSAIEEQRIQNNKKIILYNDNYFYTPIIEELYRLYKLGFADQAPSEYMTIESEIDKIIEIIKEEMN